MNLFLAETTRFFSRRLVRVSVILAFALITIVTVVQIVRGDVTTSTQQIPTGCVERINPDGSFFSDCSAQRLEPYTSTEDTRIHVYDRLEDALKGVGTTVLLVALVLGSTFIAAEFRGDSLTSQLLYEPRRVGMHVTKAVAVFTGTFVISLAISAWLALNMYANSAIKGVTDGVDMEWLTTRAGDAGRIALGVGMAAAMGYAIGVLTRRTGAAIAVFFAQLIVFAAVSPDHEVFGPISRYIPVRALFFLSAGEDVGNFLGIRTLAGAYAVAVLWIVALMLIGGAVFARAEVR